MRILGSGSAGETFTTILMAKLKLEANPKFHVRGATKIYRRACWEAIGGLWRAPGWDTIDEVKANMLGWKTHSFGDLHLFIIALPEPQTGFARPCETWPACYVSGYHPLFCCRELRL